MMRHCRDVDTQGLSAIPPWYKDWMCECEHRHLLTRLPVTQLPTAPSCYASRPTYPTQPPPNPPATPHPKPPATPPPFSKTSPPPQPTCDLGGHTIVGG
jgi:hypothetical protein